MPPTYTILLWQPWQTSTTSFPGPGSLDVPKGQWRETDDLEKVHPCVCARRNWVSPIRDITLGGKMDQVWETWYHVSIMFLYKLCLIHGRQLSLPSSYIWGLLFRNLKQSKNTFQSFVASPSFDCLIPQTHSVLLLTPSFSHFAEMSVWNGAWGTDGTLPSERERTPLSSQTRGKRMNLGLYCQGHTELRWSLISCSHTYSRIFHKAQESADLCPLLPIVKSQLALGDSDLC